MQLFTKKRPIVLVNDSQDNAFFLVVGSVGKFFVHDLDHNAGFDPAQWLLSQIHTQTVFAPIVFARRSCLVLLHLGRHLAHHAAVFALIVARFGLFGGLRAVVGIGRRRVFRVVVVVVGVGIVVVVVVVVNAKDGVQLAFVCE